MAYIKMKRKDLDDVIHDFSLSSPARKIRRLDADLSPIMEEEDPGSDAAVDQLPAAEVKDENLERAIVVFNQVNNHPFQHLSPSNFTVSVDSDFISGIKTADQSLGSSCTSNWNRNEEETSKTKMAVVPWVPSQLHLAQSAIEAVPELMEAEQMGEAAMEVEEGNICETLEQRQQDGVRANEGLRQWQQQHCLIPQLPYNTCTPISWSS